MAKLLTPKLRSLLMATLRGGHHFELDDLGIRITSDGVCSSREYLGWALELCARLTHKMDRQRHRLPSAAALADHVRAWSSFAAAHGLAFQHTPLSMRGNIDGAQICAHVVRAPHDYRFEVTLYFSQPLGLGLRVEPERLLCPTVAWAVQDHVVGDPVFDDTFLVATSNPVACTHLLDADIRRRLIAAQRDVGPLMLTDSGISLRLPRLGHPEVVPTAARELAHLAAAVRLKQQTLAA